MKSVLKVKSKNTLVTQEKIEPKYVEDKATEQYLDYINESGNVMRHNGDKYVNTGINLKGPRGAVGPRGLPGKDGITPHIGENGNWYIGELDTGSKAELNTDEYVTKEELEDVLPKYDPTNGHEYVDLGLPSGTLWATCNVGADAPEEYGNYYMYGMGNKTYNATDTPYDGTEDPLDLSRDTARQVMGDAWSMPTEAQMMELIGNTTYQWVTNYKDEGIDGGLFTATNGAVLFFPAAGSWYYGNLSDTQTIGCYWSSSNASSMLFEVDGLDITSVVKLAGFSVRGVINKDDIENKTFAQVASKADVDELKENITFTETTYPANGHDYVDLGLPSGTLWATMNVGASSETDAGLYFQWGDTQGYKSYQVGSGEGKKYFSLTDYKFNPSGDGTTFTKYNSTDGKTVLDLEDDAARANWGGSWKMPTRELLQELIKTANCTRKWTTRGGVHGCLFTSVTNGNTLFIPVSGIRLNGGAGNTRNTGYVWSSLYASNTNSAFHLSINDSGVNLPFTGRYVGMPVRGVLDATEVESTTTTYTANRVVIPIDSSKNAATNKSFINTNTAVPYITDTESYLVIRENENLHSGTVIIDASLSGKGLCCPANIIRKSNKYYIYPSLPLDSIKDNLKDLILYCYLIEDYVTQVIAHKLWFDDFPEDKLENIMDFNGLDNWEDFVAYLVNNVNKDGNRTGANGYIYTGETFNWNGSEYYLWETDGVNSTGVPYIITDTIDYNELYPNSLEADSSNKYCPYVAILTDDMEVYRTRDDDDILIKVER